MAGYPGVVVAGTAVAGLGVLLLNTQATLMMPLSIELRLGAITLIETLRHALTLAGVAVLVLAGASLFPFFGVQVAVGVVVLLLTPLVVAGVAGMRPALDRATARELLRESLPLAAALAMNVIYLRLLVILVSVQTGATETGLFATSFRIFEILLGIPTLVLAVALPLLAVAGAEDRERLRYALQRMTEAAVAASLLLVLVTVILAEPAILLLGGEDYREAAPILQVQAFALLGVFVSQVWTLGLVSLRRQRDVAVANGIALAVVIVLGVVLVRAYEGIGGAVAAIVTETLLGLLLLGFLARGSGDVAPRLRFLPRPLAAAGGRSARRAAAAESVGRGAARRRRLPRGRLRRGRDPARDRAGTARKEAPMSRPRVVVLRGHNANPWDLRPWERLRDEFDVSVLVTASNRYDLEDLDVPVLRGSALRDRLPHGRLGRFGDLASQVPGDRYLDLEGHLAGADIVHSAELGVWFSGQPAALKERLGFRLVLTVWETIPFRDTFRAARGRAYRRDALARADLFLAATERARRCLLLEGADPERIEVSYPGVDTERFAAARAEPASEQLVVSPGRLVWEKGHYDVIRALATLEQPPRLLIVGDGPERGRLLRYAADLGLRERVEIRAVPYAEMPSVFAGASCVVLGSLSTPLWEEQFGMVLAEALASGAPVLASSSGAIPEVLGAPSTSGDAQLFVPGDWAELARLLEAGPLARPAGERVEHDRELLRRYSLDAAAERLRAAYGRLLA